MFVFSLFKKTAYVEGVLELSMDRNGSGKLQYLLLRIPVIYWEPCVVEVKGRYTYKLSAV